MTSHRSLPYDAGAELARAERVRLYAAFVADHYRAHPEDADDRHAERNNTSQRISAKMREIEQRAADAKALLAWAERRRA